MAMQEPTPDAKPTAEVVGNAFVEQYYHILHTSPAMVHKFYQDSSLLSRPDVNGEMTKVTTMRDINEKIMSLNYEDHTVEIETADAQDSHEKGVIVLVTGCLTGRDNARRKFTQTFFLAPQDKGYFVLNDVFRYVGESESLVNGTNGNAPAIALTPEPGAINAPDHLATEPAAAIEEEDLDNVAEVCDPSDNEGSVLEEETIESPVHKAVESTPAAEEDAPKTYASILKAMQGNAAPRSINVPSGRAAAGATSNVQQPTVSVPAKSSAPVTLAPVSDNAPESSNHNEEVEGHSIYIRNLPYDATVELLEEEFRKFGPIKPNGIQVRSAKGSCFGFVEFEALSSMESALKASPIAIGDHHAVVEEKRTTTRVTGNNGSSRGRYSGRGPFRSDSFRGRGNYGGGRGYGRNEFRAQGEYSGRPRGSAGRGGETYQRVNQNVLGRGGRQGGGNRSSVPPST